MDLSHNKYTERGSLPIDSFQTQYRKRRSLMRLTIKYNRSETGVGSIGPSRLFNMQGGGRSWETPSPAFYGTPKNVARVHVNASRFSS